MTPATTTNAIRNETLLARIATSLRASRKRRAAYSRTRNELAVMSDRELSDIGITRSMINSVANEAARLAA